MILQGQVGPQAVTDGTQINIRQGKGGDTIVSELHGRFYEQAYRGNLYYTGTTGIVALSANTITLSATSTPILGIYNPTTSPVNAILLQANLQVNINTVTTPVPPGAFAWASSVGNSAVSTGLVPWNAKTLVQAGSQVKGFAGATALTGLTNALTIMCAADFSNLGSVTYGTIANTATYLSSGGTQNFDGGLIIPPGGVLSLVNTVSTTTMSVTGRLMWEEFAV